MKIAYNLLTTNDIDGIFDVSTKCSFTSWLRSSYESELNNPIAKYIVARDLSTNTVVGFIGIWIIVGEGDITNIAVLPEYRRNKIASNLVEKLLEVCNENNCYVINLEVRSSNIAAQNLYQSFGFKKIGLRKAYYSDNKEDAILMQKN
ncbi:ribosomal protein S18-alanine N-acetyltransferase [Clostridium sp.]|uniref:ribosomal protein S18-alanine N-acetyltransferase n=1 Tax=Clostridium sp. TaxID=1506 RepID=UPI003F312590